jgi:mannose PTS system EIIA component
MAAAVAQEQTVGVVVVTHGGSGECLLGAAASIVGELAASTAVGVSMAEDFDAIMRRVGRACDEVDSGLGVVLLVDIHGSSPFQACLAMMDGTRPAEIVCGVNLPMLLKLATLDRRELRPGEIAELLRTVGRRSIRLGSELTGKVAIAEEDPR